MDNRIKRAVSHLMYLERTADAVGPSVMKKNLQEVVDTLTGAIGNEAEALGVRDGVDPGLDGDWWGEGAAAQDEAASEQNIEERQNRLEQEMAVKRRVMEGFNRKLSDAFKLIYDVRDLVGSLKHKDPGTLFGWLGQVADQGRSHEDAIRRYESDLDKLEAQAEANTKAIDLKLGRKPGAPPPSWALPEEVQVLLHRMNGEIEALLKGEVVGQTPPPNWRHPGDGNPPPYVTAPKDADKPFLDPKHVHWRKFKDVEAPGPGVQGHPHPKTKPTDLPAVGSEAVMDMINEEAKNG